MIAAPRCAGSFFFAGGMPWKARAHAESPAPAAGFFYAGSARCGVFLWASCHAAALRRRIFPPQRNLGQRASALRFAGVFLWSVQAHFASLARFRAKCERILLCWRDFVECVSALCFSGVILGSGSVPTASLVRFRGACERTLLRWRVFVERASAFCFAGVFSGRDCVRILLFRRNLGQRERTLLRWRDFVERASALCFAGGVFGQRLRAHFASLAQFGAAGAFSRLRWRDFSLQKCFRCLPGAYSCRSARWRFFGLLLHFRCISPPPCFEDNDTRTFC